MCRTVFPVIADCFILSSLPQNGATFAGISTLNI